MSDIIYGIFDLDFVEVVEVFEWNFIVFDEVGVSVVLIVCGKIVVDFWGGYKDVECIEFWDEDIVCIVFFCIKGVVVFCVYVLVSCGLFDFDVFVSDVWFEFVQNGKEEVIVCMMLDYLVGVLVMCLFLVFGDCCDWDVMIVYFECEEVWWFFGMCNGYYMINFGWIVGEFVCCVFG